MIKHPLDLVFGPEAHTHEISELALARWPDCDVPPQHIEAMGELVAVRIADLQRRLAGGEGCCLAHALAQEMNYWYLHGYQAAQWEAAEAAVIEVPDPPEEEER